MGSRATRARNLRRRRSRQALKSWAAAIRQRRVLERLQQVASSSSDSDDSHTKRTARSSESEESESANTSESENINEGERGISGSDSEAKSDIDTDNNDKRGEEKWRRLFNVHAIECTEPFNRSPQVPPYPFIRTQYPWHEDDPALIDVGYFTSTPLTENQVESVQPGDVIAIKRFGLEPPQFTPQEHEEFAQVRDVLDEEILIRIAESYFNKGRIYKPFAQDCPKLNYGDRAVHKDSIIALQIVKKGEPILHLNHFDVQS